MSTISVLDWVRPVGRVRGLGVMTYRPALLERWVGRDMRMGVLLILLAALNGMDLAYTLFAYRIGLLNEMNPIAEVYLEQGLQTSFVCYKVLIVLAGSVMMWKLRGSKWALPGCWVLVGVHVGLGIWWYAWVREVMFIYGLHAVMGGGVG